MYNVMKAQTYQLFRSKSTYIILFLLILLLAVSIYMNIADLPRDEIAGGSYMVYTLGDLYVMAVPLLTMAFTAMILGGDMKDKTINYEVLTGTRRIEVFTGRLLVALLVNLAAYLLSTVLPALVFSLIFGWGHTMPLSDAVLRYAAGLFPLIRMTAFYALLTVLLRRPGGVFAVGYILTMTEMLASAFLNVLYNSRAVMYVFSIDAFNRMFVPQVLGYGYFDSKDISVVKDLLEPMTVVHAAAAGILGTFLFLMAGSLVIRKRDME